jgi:hypothetical protein
VEQLTLSHDYTVAEFDYLDNVLHIAGSCASGFQCCSLHSASTSFGTSLQAESPLDNFLSSLGLEKYSITFQAEEVWLNFVTANFFRDLYDVSFINICSIIQG